MTDHSRALLVADHTHSTVAFNARSAESHISAPRRYPHVLKALHERPWAVQPQTLSLMADLLRLRIEGVTFTQEEIAERVAEGREGQGDRLVNAGGVIFGNVAVIPMYGLLAQRASVLADTSTGGTGLDQLRGALADALNNPDVKAVVFDIDSPGGSVDGIPEFAAELRKAAQGDKPIVGVVNTLCASAAYWLGASMTELVITPSGEAGSIGVYAVHEDHSKAEEMEGVKTTLISAGPYKVEGNRFEPLNDEARAAIQEQIDTFYGQFLTDVARGRSRTVQAVADDFGGGRTFLADKALAAGMVDRIATLDDTVASLQKRRVTVAQPSRRAEVEALPIAATSVARSDPGFNQRMRSALKPRKRRRVLQ